METVLIWWSLSWSTPNRWPVYETYMNNERACLSFASHYAEATRVEALGVYLKQTKTCRMVVFGSKDVPR